MTRGPSDDVPASLWGIMGGAIEHGKAEPVRGEFGATPPCMPGVGFDPETTVSGHGIGTFDPSRIWSLGETGVRVRMFVPLT